MNRLYYLFLLFCCLSLTAGCAEAGKQEGGNSEAELTISAAASLQDALTDIEKLYSEENPAVTLNMNFGASGSLQKQILQGAPVDLFISASKDNMDELVKAGEVKAKDRTDLISNSLVLIVPEGSGPVSGFKDLKKMDGKVAVGQPETVPAGQYARESLENMGIWASIEDKAVFAKDVRQVLTYVETGNTQAGLVYKTDAESSDSVRIAAEAPAETYTKIVYPAGVIKESKQYEAAKALFEFLQTEKALKVLEEYGFTVE